MSIKNFKKSDQINFQVSNRDNKLVSVNSTIDSASEEETKKIFGIKISPDTLNEIKDFKLESIAKATNMPGFRPGKAPLSVVWKQHEDGLTSEIINDSVDAVIKSIIKEAGLELATSPKVEVKDFSFEKGIDFSLTLEVLPKFDMPEVSKISLNKPTYTIGEAEIQERVKGLFARFKNHASAKKNTKAAKGDQVIIDFEGKIDGELFDGGAAKGHNLELGSGSFIDNFEDQIIGHKVGDELVAKVKFPENYHEAKFAGKAAEFAVKINDILQATEFANEEELAKFIKAESVEDMHTKIKETIEHECSSKAKLQMQTELFDKLDEIMDFPLPQTMLDEEFKTLWARVEELRKNGNEEVNKPEEELKEEYLKLSKRRVKLGIVLTQMAQKYNIKIEQNDFVDAIRAQASSYHPSAASAVVEHYSKNPKALETLKGPILEKKTVDAILKEVSYVEVSTEVKKLLEVE